MSFLKGSREWRLRRVVILCQTFMRNLAYFRAANSYRDTLRDPPFTPEREVLITSINNNLDVCVTEWCKLFGEPEGKHAWEKIVSCQNKFAFALQNDLGMSAVEIDTYKRKMRRLRDKFIAHLDSDEKMDYPKLEQARKSVVFYHSYLVTHEAQAGVLDGLIASTEQFSLYFSSCKVHAEKTYRILTQTSQK